ncbi:hypothetical protein NMY22_g3277 [Coprinellus aureogranulatus]|nr:hypothetical protein NMY22_g3277 [Coprinellus aureogranulatus]
MATRPKAMPGYANSTPVKPTPVKAYWLSQNFARTHQFINVDKMKTMTRFLMKENEDYQHANIDLLLFARHVWGLSEEDGEKLLNMEITLDPEEIQEYKNVSHETKLHKPFVRFADQLLALALEAIEDTRSSPSEVEGGEDDVFPAPRLRNPPRRMAIQKTPPRDSDSSSNADDEEEEDAVNAVTNFFWDGNGSKALKQGGRVRKPDMLSLWSPLPKGVTPRWAFVKNIIEFKKESKESAPLPRPALPKDGTLRKGRQAMSTSNLLTKTGAFSSSSSHQSSGKRNREAAKETLGDSDRKDEKSNKKVRTDRPLAEKHFQLVAYATEALAATSRIWVVGLVVDVCRVTVCYFDRSLIARASSFNFEFEPAKLALVLYCMHESDLLQAGFDRHLRPWPSATPDDMITEDMQEELNKPVKKLEGSYFEYVLDARAEAFLRSIIPIFPEDFVAICNSGNMALAGDSPGSDTLDDSASDVSDSANSDESQGSEPTLGVLSMRITGVIRAPDSDLVCRGTAVYKVKIQLPGGGETENSYAYKLSQPLTKRDDEFEVIMALRNTLSAEALKHLPEVFFTQTAHPQDLSIPWLHFGLPLNENNYQDRVQRGIGFKLYQALWEAGSLENFKKVWLDCVEVHYLAYKIGKTLHRDVSEHNLMVAVSADGSTVGILNDWDMSKRVGEEDDGITAAKHRTGTPPFMAMDLLAGKKSPHYLRHDLEAFFWILVWAVVHYNLTDGTRDDEVHPLLKKMVDTPEENGLWKSASMTLSSTFVDDLTAAAKPEFEELCESDGWVHKLLTLLITAKMQWEVEVMSRGELPRIGVAGHDTYGGRITFKTFVKKIGVEPRDWGYKGFLDED